MYIHLVVIAWTFVVFMMTIAEALSPQGTVLGAILTFLLYGVLPLSVLVYILGTPARKRALRAREAQSAGPTLPAAQASIDEGDGRSHAPAGTVPPERDEA